MLNSRQKKYFDVSRCYSEKSENIIFLGGWSGATRYDQWSVESKIDRGVRFLDRCVPCRCKNSSAVFPSRRRATPVKKKVQCFPDDDLQICYFVHPLQSGQWFALPVVCSARNSSHGNVGPTGIENSNVILATCRSRNLFDCLCSRET